jgi:Acetokinase family
MTDESAMKPAHRRILTINGGSSSIKFALFEVGDSFQRVLEGEIERIGLPDAALRVKGSSQADNFVRPVTAPDHAAAVGVLMDWIERHSGRDVLSAVGHRIVHGGPKYSEPQRVTPEMVAELQRLPAETGGGKDDDVRMVIRGGTRERMAGISARQYSRSRGDRSAR